ncbi:hypothetical protein BCR34DRAFT_587115 [Clohesyomyces aquaticus]|uniref:Uncharacterized protein n=1 Tax=Clohesyomyces aquaticus TaxID=1231657 RepID=A0A1Y1ZS62_9PLEO|nr:hypothetical protein BCR34DRAFT_587115 [Clohesyomyces aquaticus]
MLEKNANRCEEMICRELLWNIVNMHVSHPPHVVRGAIPACPSGPSASHSKTTMPDDATSFESCKSKAARQIQYLRNLKRWILRTVPQSNPASRASVERGASWVASLKTSLAAVGDLGSRRRRMTRPRAIQTPQGTFIYIYKRSLAKKLVQTIRASS